MGGGGKERETYVDYMGGALYPESLVDVHAEFLKSCVLGNTHSESNRCVSFSFALVLFSFFFFSVMFLSALSSVLFLLHLLCSAPYERGLYVAQSKY